MSKQNPIEASQRIAAILRQRASPLAEVIIDGMDVRELPRHIREKIVDELGEEFSAKGLKPDSEPNAYGCLRSGVGRSSRSLWRSPCP
jgi:hypothetical protein